MFGLVISTDSVTQHFSHFFPIAHLSKVSTRFEFFVFEFACESVVILNLVVLHATFSALLNSVTFREGHQAKPGTFT